MASASVESACGARAGELLADCVSGEGSASHPWSSAESLLAGPDCARNLADLVHFLCILHGRYPGVIDHAAGRTLDPQARGWLTRASYAFAGERAYLARLAVAAGPLPSTPGAADSDSTVMAQRHAIEMLARSERDGCALGAALAVILDWAAVRRALDAAARRFGVDVPPWSGEHSAEAVALADCVAPAAGVQRALLFGAGQILVQHRGLWDLLEARASARSAA